MSKPSQNHTRKSQNRRRSEQGADKIGPRVIYRMNRRLRKIQVAPGAIRQVWMVVRRRGEVTAPEVVEATELHPKTAENCLFYLRQLGFVHSAPLRAVGAGTSHPQPAGHAA